MPTATPHTHCAPSRRDALSQALFASTERSEDATPVNPVRWQDLAQAPWQLDGDDLDEAPEWSEEDVVHLHWRLLLELRRLPDPDTPLEEKLDTLAWALTDPALDGRPFSFANCLRVVGTSPLSPTAYFGAVQIDEVRDWLRAHANEWIRATVAKYPDWVQTLVRKQPDWIAKQLSRNPQWLNEQIKARQFETHQGDLFAWQG